jgi:hypothetical protein
MATDYDAPRKTEDDSLAEDSIEELKARRVDKAASTVDVDETELAENLELPGADLSDESLSVRVLRPVLPGAPPQPARWGAERPARVQGVRLT